MSRVAVVEFDKDVPGSLRQAIELIGGIDDLNSTERSVVVKPGVFDHRSKNHPTVDVVRAIVDSFNKAPRIFVAESDNYRGTGSERLQIWREVFTERVVPFNLSEDANTRQSKIADEKIGLSQTLFKPNVFVSTHVLRRFRDGTILKNLLGLIPDIQKMRFHEKLVATLLDAYEAIGGIDLAVLDGTHAYLGPSSDKGVQANVLLVGRDAVAVEAVGTTLAGLDPREVPVIQEAMNRGLGEGDVRKIEVLGSSIEDLKRRISRPPKV